MQSSPIIEIGQSLCVMKGDRSESKNGLTGLDRATQDIWADESVKKKKKQKTNYWMNDIF